MPTKIELRLSVSNWSFREKICRGLWELVYIFLWPTHFRFFSRWRVFLLSSFGAKIHGPVLIMDHVRVWIPWRLKIGAFSAIGSGCELYNFGEISIGSNSVISQRTYICTASHDYSRRNMPLIWTPIKIGDCVWVAAECFIGPGITIGDGAVIGARSVVTKNVEAWTVNAGTPCKFIKSRTVE